MRLKYIFCFDGDGNVPFANLKNSLSLFIIIMKKIRTKKALLPLYKLILHLALYFRI